MNEFPDPTLEELEKLANGATESDSAKLYARFKFLVDDVKGRAKWQALRDRRKDLDRDALVARVWSELESAPHKEAIEKQYHSLPYHRLWLFDWLLGRYDLRRARTVAGGGAWARNAHYLLLSAVAGVLVLRHLGRLGSHATFWTCLLCGAAYACVLAGLAHSFKAPLSGGLEAHAVAAHSLIPRFAGAAAVGLVILASSRDLLQAVAGTEWWWLIGLFGAGYGYLLLEMARRVHPLPRLRRLALHALDIAATALAHSMTVALLAENALRRVLAGGGAPPFGWREAFGIAVFVFSIGLVVNLIWAEQPITEPL